MEIQRASAREGFSAGPGHTEHLVSVSCHCGCGDSQLHSSLTQASRPTSQWGQVPPHQLPCQRFCPHRPAGWASHSETLLPVLTVALAGLNRDYSHVADGKAEDQRDCIPSRTPVWQLVTGAGLSPGPPGCTSEPPSARPCDERKGCGLAENRSGPRFPPPRPPHAAQARGSPGRALIPSPPQPLPLPPGCQEATSGEVKNEPVNVLRLLRLS